MKKTTLILFLFSILFVGSIKAQTGSSYTNAVGIKFYPGGITFKHFLNEKNALEGIGYFYSRGTRITGLYEINYPISEVEGLKWYIGPGAHLGFFNSNNGGGVSLGVDGVLGLDYKIAEAPLNISLDIQPALELANSKTDNRLNVWGGIGIRYTF